MNNQETRKSFKLKYGKFYLNNSSKIQLNEKNIPVKLVNLIPYAEFWGAWGIENNQNLMDTLLEKSPKSALIDLADNLEMYDEELTGWLKEEEMEQHDHSKEYIAFSAMRILADYAF